MDRLLTKIGVGFICAAGVIAYLEPTMPAWLFMSIVGAGIVMVAGDG